MPTRTRRPSKPTSLCREACRLRTNSPASTSSTTDSATWPTTRIARRGSATGPIRQRAAQARDAVQAAGGGNGRREPEGDRGEGGDRDGRGQDGGVDAEVEPHRHRQRRLDCSSAASIHCATARPAAGGEHGEQARLDEHLAYEPAAARPERHAHGDSCCRSAARATQQAGDVGACHQQHQGHRQRQHSRKPVTPPASSGGKPQRALRCDGDAPGRAANVGPLAGVAACRRCAIVRNCSCAWASVAHRPRRPTSACRGSPLGARPASSVRPGRHRDRGRVSVRCSRRGDRHDRRRVPADADAPPDHARIAGEAALPVPMGQDHGGGGRLGERAARQQPGRGAQVEDVEVVRADRLDEDALRLGVRRSG